MTLILHIDQFLTPKNCFINQGTEIFNFSKNSLNILVFLILALFINPWYHPLTDQNLPWNLAYTKPPIEVPELKMKCDQNWEKIIVLLFHHLRFWIGNQCHKTQFGTSRSALLMKLPVQSLVLFHRKLRFIFQNLKFLIILEKTATNWNLRVSFKTETEDYPLETKHNIKWIA